MDKWLEVLMKVGISKGAATIALATAVLLACSHFGILPVPLAAYLPALWLACVLACAFLVLDLGARLLKWAKAKVAPPANVADNYLYAAYRNLDADEKRVLRVFVERHLTVLYLKDLGSTQAELEPVRRLRQRNFLYVEDSYRLEGEKVELDRDHFRALVENPQLVDSKAAPRSFG